jgi:hypothetical protein
MRVPAKTSTTTTRLTPRMIPSAEVFLQKGLQVLGACHEHDQTGISETFCASAQGKMVPPMVIRKALNLYSSWC